jgi:hypothetical protein
VGKKIKKGEKTKWLKIDSADQCSRSHAPSADKKRKFLSSPTEQGLFTAEIATKSTRNHRWAEGEEEEITNFCD